MALMKIDYNPLPKTLRMFGYIGAVLFPALAYAAHKNWIIFRLISAISPSATAFLFWVMLVLGAYSAIGALVAPGSLRPLFVGLSFIGVPIGIVVLYTMLAITYFLVITPISLIFKLIGRDAMHRKFEPAATTYWIKRTPTRDVKRYFRQF